MYAEPPEISRQSWPIARKLHTCCECGGTIAIGKKYDVIWGVWERTAFTFKTCMRCSTVRGKHILNSAYLEEGPPLGCLIEWLREDGLIEEAELLTKETCGQCST